MSVYAVNKLCRRVVHEPALRDALAVDPEPVLRAADPPLSSEEIRALCAGDVGALSKAGCNHFLLHQLGRWQLFGLDLPTYAERIRAAHGEQPRAAPG
jgi:Aromatic-ring-opening dioxygenase LigAB, LigA subunit